MPGSTLSVFGEPDEYEAALRVSGVVDLLVTGRGPFRARLTKIALARMQLLAGEETLSRVAFIGPLPRVVRVSLPVRSSASLFWGSIASHDSEIVTHGPDWPSHERTDGPSRWKTIWLPAKELIAYARTLTGEPFAVPPGACRWQPSPSALRSLSSLYDQAMRANRVQPRLAAGATAAHGLEQQLIHALVDCLSVKATVCGVPAKGRHADLMSRFEDILRALPGRPPSIRQISTMLGVADNTLRASCAVNLGMSPLRYVHQRRMRSAYRDLRIADADGSSVTEIARRHGFSGLSRFAADYREQFGESPSTTLRNGAV